jgi:hypothetical protein
MNFITLPFYHFTVLPLYRFTTLPFYHFTTLLSDKIQQRKQIDPDQVHQMPV